MAATKQKYEKGTAEGDALIKVRVMKPCVYGPTPKLERRYEIGEELVIPRWRFTDYHEPEVVKGLTFRGAFELADRPKPVDSNVGQHPEEMVELMAQNEDYAKRIAELEKRLGDAPEPTVVVDEPGKRGPGRPRKEEI